MKVQKKILFFILFVIYIGETLNKNLVFPFKKLTIEFFNETKSISDFIDFNIYANISIGTPSQIVAQFILNSNRPFSLARMSLQGHGSASFINIEKQIENTLDIFYNYEKSSTYKVIDNYYQVYADIFTFKDLNNNEISKNLEFSMTQYYEKKTCGIIDLLSRNSHDEPEDPTPYLFEVLRGNDLIDNYYITFIYDEYDYEGDKFNYLNDDYNNILAKVVIGASAHEINPDKYKEEDEIKINGYFDLYINEIKFKNKKSNYIEKDVKVTLKYDSEFIKGSYTFRNEIDNIFFNELIYEKLCIKEIIEENIYISKDIVYSCENTETLKEKLKYFPNLYFEMKEYNLTFLFNYKELFKLHDDRIYFLIYFKEGSLLNYWEIGELFLRKYITSFNYDSKTISFYKNQIDEINIKTDIPYPDEDPEEEEKEEEREEEKEEERKERKTEKEEEKEDEKEEEREEERKEEERKEEEDEKEEEKEKEKEKEDEREEEGKEEEKEEKEEDKKEEEKEKEDEKEDESSDEPAKSDPVDNSNTTRLVIQIVMGVVILIAVAIIIIFIVRWRKTRKQRENELNDDFLDEEESKEKAINS